MSFVVPAPSRRLDAVQSPIIPVVAGWIREHPGTISLGQGVVSYGPPPEAQRRLEAFWQDPQNHKYKPVPGLPELIQAIRTKLRAENGLDAGESQIFVTAGGNLAFAAALLAIADPGDEVILQLPYYFNHEMAVTMASCVPVTVPTDENYQLQPALIRAAITGRTRAIVTISPNNPSGAVYTAETLREINHLCRERNLFHIHDEAYEYFVHGRARHFSPGSLDGARDHTLSLFSLSKAYGFASWRIGYLVAPPHLAGALKKILDTLLICAPVISQFAALGALEAGHPYCAARLPELTRVRDIFLDRLREISGLCDLPPADGAFYLLLRLKTGWDPLQLAEALIREHQVAVIPGTAFGMAGCHLRVAYGVLTPETAQEGATRLIRGLRALLGSGG